jgi:hypothetical protein
MNVSRPEAEDEYSSTQRPFRAPRGASGAPRGGGSGARRSLVLGAGLAGALLLVGAELTPLLHLAAATGPAGAARVVRTVQTGPHDGWALVPIAVAVVLLSLWAWRTGSRLALAAVGVLGVAALAIALLRDLPGAHATGLVGSPARGLHTARGRAAVGLYLETLGGAVVLLAAAAGMLLAPRARNEEETRGLPTARDRGLR